MAAMCPANEVTKVLKPVSSDSSENAPLEKAFRGEAIRVDVV